MNRSVSSRHLTLPGPRATVPREAILVAMSGGVDSSLAAALLVEQGYAVAGVTLRLLWPCAEGDTEAASCCSREALEGARRVCQLLGIPHHALDLSGEFAAAVVEPFIQAYAAGRTPNPCLECNRHVKFDRLLRWARAEGFARLATGHYARIARGGEDAAPYHLLRGLDRRKDQSYVLSMLGQEQLAHLLFPLGGMTKAAVRREAARRGLPTAGRPESQEICFVPGNDYRRFLSRHVPGTPGPIRDLSGKVLGAHRGLHRYTVGQHKGLGLSGRPEALYVVALDAAENAVVVGPEEALLRPTLEAVEVTFTSGEWPAGPLRVEAQVRYRAPAAPATLWPLEPGRVRLEFDVPQRAIAPGQAAVFYEGEEVLGGGTIA